jgi:hypothetical protein
MRIPPKNPISLALSLTQILELEKDLRQIRPIGPLSAHLLWTINKYVKILALLYKDSLVSSSQMISPEK